MAVWRRKALALFPELRRDLHDPGYSIYMLYFDLLPLVRELHASGNIAALDPIYGFAEWCLVQTTGDLHNAVAVAFYEHLFNLPQYDWPAIIVRLSPTVIEQCWGLWGYGLPLERVQRVHVLLERALAGDQI